MLKPVEGGFVPHKTNSAEQQYQSNLRAAMSQHGSGPNVFNPIGTNPQRDQPIKPNALIQDNFFSVSTFDNRAPEGGTTGEYGNDYSSLTEIPQGPNDTRQMQANDGRIALALQGKSYFANLNNPMQEGQRLFGGNQVG